MEWEGGWRMQHLVNIHRDTIRTPVTQQRGTSFRAERVAIIQPQSDLLTVRSRIASPQAQVQEGHYSWEGSQAAPVIIILRALLLRDVNS